YAPQVWRKMGRGVVAVDMTAIAQREAKKPWIAVPRTTTDLGATAADRETTCEFELTNVGRVPVQYALGPRACPVNIRSSEAGSIAPGETAVVQLAFRAAGGPGHSYGFEAELYTNDPD